MPGIRLNNVGLSDEGGTTEMNLNLVAASDKLSSAYDIIVTTSCGKVLGRTIAGGTYFQECGCKIIDFLTVDVEGNGTT